MNRLAGSSLGIIVLGLVLGCHGLQPASVAETNAGIEPGPVVRLAPGDVVDIKFFSVPELNESQAVRPDGKIALQLVGEVHAMGKTPAELREELMKIYVPHLKAPDVTVIVRQFLSRRIYVGGEVREPGSFDMPGQLSALEAIMQAGGFTNMARLGNVVIIRHKDGQRFGASLDFRDALAGDVTAQFLLEPLDIVFVPRTRISKVTQWIDQHINQLLPMFGVVYSFPVGRGGATVTIDTTRARPIR
jgi:protein involved in polysaccharide export with SLBB domain